MASRGQIVVVDFAIAGLPKKVRPVLVVQADSFNQRMANTVVAMITTNLARAGEASHQLVDITTPAGKQSGLLHSSVINCNTLTTVRQQDILRVIRIVAHRHDATDRPVPQGIARYRVNDWRLTTLHPACSPRTAEAACRAL